MDASYLPARRILGASLFGAGKPDEAVAELTVAAGHDGEDAISLAWLAHAKALAGAQEEAGAILGRLRSDAPNLHVPRYHLAIAHAGLGDWDAAFALLAAACADREPAVVNLKVEPRLEPLHRDARYGALLERLNLQP